MQVNSNGDDESDPIEKRGNPLTWKDFTADFHSSTMPFDEVKSICELNADKLIDLRPYMQPRPYTCNERDSI
jgi:hypothetical protein